MSDQPKMRPTQSETGFSRKVGVKAARKLRAQQDNPEVVWTGLSVMGLIGWSIVVPTLLGAALGHWLDAHYPMSHSWTLTLIMMGLSLGCWNAWHWVKMENRSVREEQEHDDA
ncbi:MAG: AtpZ/AtpI family protein [Sulfuriferula sp.]|nr:AtpZ/AtpI family protein [Sulfuriferula sp.]